ncbi:nucleotide exchange factor GrpE [Actinocorallia sp. B10E7]|uniref:nucleotide exchange factor GrpE n=1 Tax=Actinocorallia sp. B10E7 TaxID=3153558 RepID=UPI00325F4BF4
MNEDVSGTENDGIDAPFVNERTSAEFGQVVTELRRLREAFDAKIRYDETRERHVQAMSEELAQHRQDLYRSVMRPVLTDLVALYDDLTQVIEATDASGASLALFRDSVEQILERNGVQRFIVEGDGIDRSLQRVLSTVATSDRELDRKVAVRLRAGFADGDRVLRPEWVSAYRFAKPQPVPELVADPAVEAADSAAPAEEGDLR